MKLEKIITLASPGVRLRFLAMERSLRATGCNLPLLVIPYDNNRFDLPANSSWWENKDLINWLDEYKVFPATRKYQCFLTSNYQFVDSDIIFLTNPEVTLSPTQGFVTSCIHWVNTIHTYTSESLAYLESKTTTWQKYMFNSGQFACDRELYTLLDLKTSCLKYKSTLLLDTPIYKDQPAINFLVHLSAIPVSNLTLPPYNMESTWAGSYNNKDYKKYWAEENKKPYLIHWAGCEMNTGRPIDELFLDYLTNKEKEEWTTSLKNKKEPFLNKIRTRVSKFKNGLKLMLS